jgi:hypothetical protein
MATDWDKAAEKAYKTGKTATTFTKKKLNELGWRCVDFRSSRGYERRNN